MLNYVYVILKMNGCSSWRYVAPFSITTPPLRCGVYIAPGFRLRGLCVLRIVTGHTPINATAKLQGQKSPLSRGELQGTALARPQIRGVSLLLALIRLLRFQTNDLMTRSIMTND